MNLEKFNQVASIYNSTRPVPEELLLFFKNEVFLYLENIKQKKRYSILSIGLGTGRAELCLSSKRTELFGLDLNEKMIRETLAYKHFTFPCVGNGLTIPFNHSFDLVSMIHTIQFIKPLDKFLLELKKVTDVVCIGDLYTSLYDNIIVNYYAHKLEENQFFTLANSLEKIEDKLKKWGILSIRKSEMKTKIQLKKIYTIIEKRSLSRFWDVPTALHERAMESLKTMIKQEKVDLDEEIKTTAKAILRFIHFS